MPLTREQFQQLRSKGLSVEQIVKFESGETPDKKTATAKRLGDTIINEDYQNNSVNKNLTIGALKGVGETVSGIGSLGERVLQTATAPISLAQGKPVYPQTGGQKIKESGVLEAQGTAQKVGKFAEQVGEYIVPLSKIGKIEKGMSNAQKAIQLGKRALTSGSVATAQEGKIGSGTAIAAGTELALPGVGKAINVVTKPVTGIVKRLIKGLGAGLSGVSTDALEKIYSNPNVARAISKKVVKEGQESVLEKNAKTIMNGVSKIKKEASKKYEKGLEQLSEVDINPEAIYNSTVGQLEKNGIQVIDTGVDMSNSEILNEAIQKRASKIIEQINESTNSNGKQIRSLIKKIESSKFSNSADPDRAAFNVLMDDLGKGIKDAINESTDKLRDINLEYSNAKILTDGIQKIFGKVKFKNNVELGVIAKKLETIFNQKGLDPKMVDSFLKRIKVNPDEFRTSEAVRGIMDKKTGANTKGLSIGEVVQQFTSAVVTPNAVKNAAIMTGIAEKTIQNIVNKTKPAARAAIIKGLIEANKK